jgi:hypothetical protein
VNRDLKTRALIYSLMGLLIRGPDAEGRCAVEEGSFDILSGEPPKPKEKVRELHTKSFDDRATEQIM